MTINFTKKFAPLIAKEIIKEINSTAMQLIKYRNKEMENKKDYNSVRSQRHWKAVAAVELSLARIKELYHQLVDLDNQTGWSDDLHQDRYKFKNKYPSVINEYISSYKPGKGDLEDESNTQT